MHCCATLWRCNGLNQILVLIKGAGDLATGVAHRLFRAGFRVLMTELAQPTVIRRTVSFAEAIYTGENNVEGISARVATEDNWQEVLAQAKVPVLVDPEAKIIGQAKPEVVIDAIIAKKNLGTNPRLAPVVIALGPGFSAPEDAHAVIETQRGHDLGRVIYRGQALPNTGVPGEIGGKSWERVLRAPRDGVFQSQAQIGDFVQAGQVVGHVEGVPVSSLLTGYLRGILRDGLEVHEGMKIGDVDPRAEKSHCFTISDKARALGGAVLEAMLYLLRQQGVL